MSTLKDKARVAIVAAVVLGVAAVAGAAGAPNDAEISKVVNTHSGVAIHGYDPVAYFEDGEAARGLPDLQEEHAGATYLFRSDEHRDMFRTDPDRYLPQFGGFSVYGVTLGRAYDVNPETFDVVDGKLYLSRNERVRELWHANRDGYIDRAESVWSGLDGDELR